MAIDPRLIPGNKTYHYREDLGLGFPKSFRAPRRLFDLRYTKHAQAEAAREEHGAFDPPYELNTDRALLVQVVLDPRGRLVQATWRVKYDEVYDAVLVVDPDRQMVVTCWLNKTTDDHPHLDISKYDRPE
jgi:hypothetical protein